MDRIRRLLTVGETRLINSTLAYARSHGYAENTSTLARAWQLSIAGLTEALLESWPQDGDIPAHSSGEPFENAPGISFISVEAARHRERGLPLSEFMGLFKYYRKAYLAAAAESDLLEIEKSRAADNLNRAFDRMELAICREYVRDEDTAAHDIKETNRFLVNEKNRYLTLFASLPEPAILVDRHGRIADLNKSAADFLGLSNTPGSKYYCALRDRQFEFREMLDDDTSRPFPGDVHFRDLLPWLDVDLPRDCTELVTEKTIEDGGLKRFVEVRIAPMADISGKFDGAVLVIRDITDIRAAQHALMYREEQMQYIIKHTPIALAVFDDQMRYITVSDRYLKDHDLRGDGLAGRCLYDVFPETPERHRAAHERCLAGSTEKSEEDLFIRLDGSMFYNKWECRPWFAEDDSIGGVILYSEIITEQVLMEKASRENELRFRRTFENSPVMMHSINTDGLICDVNQKWLEEMGYLREEVIGRPMENFLAIETVASFREIIAEFWRRERITDVEYRCVKKSGEVIDLLVDSSVVDDPVWGKISITVLRNVTEQKLAQEAIALSERKYRTLVSNAPVGILSMDSEGAIIEVNRTLLEILGSPSALATKQINMLRFPPLVKAGISELFRRCIRESLVVHAELPYLSKWGRTSYLRFLITPTVDIDGKVTGCQAVVEDFTKRKEAEDTLARESAVNSALAALYIPLTAPQLSIRRVAETVLEMARKLTASPEGFVSELDPYTGAGMTLTLRNTQGSGAASSSQEIVELTGNNGGLFEEILGIEVDANLPLILNKLREHLPVVNAPNGPITIHRLISVPVMLGDRVLGRILLVNREGDYTEHDLRALNRLATYYALALDRNRAEIVMKRLAVAVGQSAEAIMVTDTQGRIEYVNPAFERITGWSADEALGKTPAILRSDKQGKEFYQRMWRTVASGEDWTGRVINKRKDGTLYYEDEKISPVRDPTGKIINFVAMKRDITQEILLEKQLAHSQKMEALGTFVGGIAHDFNNILQAILGYADLLLLDRTEASPDFAELEVIVKSALSGAELVQRLLTFGHKTESRFRITDLNDEIVQTKKLLSRTIPKMIGIELKLEEDLSPVQADSLEIERVLMNLAVNAKNAMPKGGKLAISTSSVTLTEEFCKPYPEARPGPYVLITISDTGVGMDRELMTRIFDPFFTTKSLGTEKGTGLGLSIVYGIVKKHGGFIVCESELGKGSVFKIYLPSVKGRAGIDESSQSSHLPHGHETVLLVDDEDFIRDLGARILNLAGYKVVTACDGEEALAIFRADPDSFALVVLDLLMPHMGGEQCYQELLKINPRLRVIIASGYSDESFADDLFENKRTTFVNKPYDSRQFLMAVREALDRG